MIISQRIESLLGQRQFVRRFMLRLFKESSDYTCDYNTKDRKSVRAKALRSKDYAKVV